MKYIKYFENHKDIDPFNEEDWNESESDIEDFTKGDLVQLKYNIERDENDGEYGYSINSGEIGEIRYIVSPTENERDENKVYMVKFSDKDGKKRYIQLTKQSFSKVSK